MSPARGYDVDSKQFKLLQAVPALVTFALIFAPVWVSFLGYPQFVIYYIAFVTIFWVYRAAVFSVSSVIGYQRYKRDIAVDWAKQVKELQWSELPNPELLPSKIEDLKVVLFIPFYKEQYEMLAQTVRAIAASDYPHLKESVYVVFGVEESAGEAAVANAKKLQKEFGKQFADLQYYVHPAGIEGEVQGIAGANLRWASKSFCEYIEKKHPQMDLRHFFALKFDSDLCMDQKLMSALVHRYLTSESRYNRFFTTAMLLYNNNYWQVPALMRQFVASLSLALLNSWVAEKGWQESFSCYGFNLHLLKAIDYWNPKIGVDDTGFFYDAYFHLRGNFSGEEVYVPGHMDAVESSSYVKTHVAQYRQLLRWGWGVIVYPATLQAVFQYRKLSPWKAIIRLVRLFYVYNFMRTTVILLNIGIPLVRLVNDGFNFYAQAHLWPQIGSILLTFAWVFLIPPRIVLEKMYGAPPINKGRLFYLWHYVEQIMIIINMFTYLLVPDLHAQLEMLLGRGKKAHYVAEKSARPAAST